MYFMTNFVADAVLFSICKVLDEKNIPHFLGGSRRFRFNTEHSDLDISILYESDNDDKIVILKHLNSIFGPGIISGEDGYRGSSNFVFSYQGFHILVYTSKYDYDDERKKHDILENFLQANNHIVDLIRELKTINVITSGSGAALYKMLCNKAIDDYKKHVSEPSILELNAYGS